MPTTLIAAIVMELAVDWAVAETIVYMAITFAVSTIASRFLSPNGNQSANTPDSGSRQQVPPDTTQPIPVVYGDAYIGGKFCDAVLRDDQKVMFYVMALSCISENGYFSYDTSKMYYGDRLITFDPTEPTRVASLTDTAGNVDTSIFNLLFISLYTSNSAGVITPINLTQKPWEYKAGDDGTSLLMGTGSGIAADQQWASTNRNMNGLAFAVIRLTYSQNSNTTQLQPITFHVSQYLFDTGYAGAGSVWYDYMTNKIYGGAVDPEFIDADSAVALEAYGNELITFNDYNGNPQTQPRYRINGVIDPSQSCLQNVDQIMTACDSWQRYDATSGKWSVVINEATSVSYNFDDSNLVGAIVVGTVDLAQMPNQIQARFPDSTNRDQYNYVNESVPSGLLLPNEPVNKLNVNYDLVNNSVQSLYLANRVLEQSREDLLVTISTTYDGIQVNAGDVVTITNSYYGWTNKPFRAMQVKESIAVDGILSAQIQLIEYNAGVYDNATINQYTPSANGNLNNPSYFSALSPPNPVNVYPYSTVPTFDINIATPTTGRVSSIILYYTTVATPTSTDWAVLDTQSLTGGEIFANGIAITFPHYTIPANTYYFAYTVGNDIALSTLSPISSAFVWAPDPANANSFVSTLSPVTLQVPYNGSTPTLTGINFKLYGSNGLGPVPYVEASDDTDPAFVPDSWRIGYNDNTGYATDIIQTGITFPLPPTDLGSYAQFGTATAMTASPATVQIPVRYKDLAGNVHLIPTSTIQAVYSVQGDPAYQHNTAYLYQWSTTTPSNPSGTSIFNWANGTSSSYTGSGGWDVAIPSNPNIPLIKLWRASIGVNDVATATTTTVSWASGYAVADITQNGADGVQSASPTVFQWAITIPSGPTGSSTYTWATAAFTPIPSGWYVNAGDPPSVGYTLWGASVSLVDSAGTTTSTINWTTASITARGYSGSTGTTGSSARICYASTTSSSLNSTPTTYTTSGSSSFPPYNTWGGSETWVATPPSISAGQSVYQSDGIYSPTTGNTVWNVPYLSSLKVGELSAITANLGTVTAGNINGLTITGGVFQTAASGTRVTISQSTNDMECYVNDIYGTHLVSVLGSANNGGLLIDTRAVGTLYPCVLVIQRSNGGGISGVDIPSIEGVNELGDGLHGVSKANGIGVIGEAWITGGTNHGLRGLNAATTGGISTDGLIGVANGYDFYADGAGTNYGPFTGAHDVLVPVGTTIPIGYIVCDVKLILAKNISNTVFEVTESTSANQVPIGVMVVDNGLLANYQPAAFIEKFEYTEVDGALVPTTIMYPEYYANKDLYDYCLANAVGEGQVYVCNEAGNIAAGDLIVTSSTAGVGMKQSDNIVRNITVAKAREAVIFTDSSPQLVACIYLCG